MAHDDLWFVIFLLWNVENKNESDFKHAHSTIVWYITRRILLAHSPQSKPFEFRAKSLGNQRSYQACHGDSARLVTFHCYMKCFDESYVSISGNDICIPRTFGLKHDLLLVLRLSKYLVCKRTTGIIGKAVISPFPRNTYRHAHRTLTIGSDTAQSENSRPPQSYTRYHWL